MPTLLIEHGATPGSSGTLGTTLREFGHRFRTIMVAKGESLPTDLDDVAAIVLTDGPQTLSSGASAPAGLAAELELIRTAHAKQLPILGLGMGARLLAAALGGEITSGGDCGWRSCTLNSVGREDPLYKGVAWNASQLFWQRESITRLPDGATALATSVSTVPGAKAAVRAFAAGVFAFGFEHRFEMDAALLDRQIAERGSELASFGTTPEVLRSGWNADGATSERLGRRMAESIALYLMPVDRVSSGRVKDLHY